MRLKKSTRSVVKDRIQKSWQPLSEGRRREVALILRTCSRLVLHSIQSESRKETAESWLVSKLEKMEQGLLTLPVPKPAKKQPLLTQLSTINYQLEQQLYSDLEHIEKLRLELQYEYDCRKADQENLSQMSENLKANQERYMDKSNRLHPVLRKQRIREEEQMQLLEDICYESDDDELSSNSSAIPSKLYRQIQAPLSRIDKTLQPIIQLQEKLDELTTLLHTKATKLPGHVDQTSKKKQKNNFP
ncbi:Sim4 and Mal2 associated protein 7 [Schizosaccharomyces japonicus yFS275]|uniref:Sim4 and Mal2 associated protein 7 n=1 Tax=Schizosaccharomyces japonicus (strain yFS275 / FY16936) TaxID=402676 RepID=B6JZA1_SCHJY|nr:Sim4 and Mal2 associated protein 7 [Schizosaccharomyces japonicus yFS275]EEB06869.1 Sim4 and Mal2 associated protein 7 [Schizosaccharomyces japonicus yFS275]